MSTSLLGAGGECVINITQNSYANAAILFDNSVYDGNAQVVTQPDGAAGNAYTIVNTGSAGEPTLWINLSNVHNSEGVPVYPGERVPFINGFNGNSLATIRGWISAPRTNGSVNAATALYIGGGIQRANS